MKQLTRERVQMDELARVQDLARTAPSLQGALELIVLANILRSARRWSASGVFYHTDILMIHRTVDRIERDCGNVLLLAEKLKFEALCKS